MQANDDLHTLADEEIILADPAFSLTIENASSTDYTLTIMTWAAVIFLPLVLLYQGWTYWIFRKRVSRSRIEKAAEVVH